MGPHCLPRALWSRLARDVSGAMTMFGLFVFLSMAVVGGLAIDVSHVHAERVRLQAMADAAAHATLVSRRKMSAEAAKAAAVAMVQAAEPDARRGDVLLASDISFGSFDYVTGKFTANSTGTKAVRVSTARLANRGNAVASYLTNLIGIDSWDVSREAVFVSYSPGCSEQGFLSEGPIDVQSNNAYLNGFCMHSNTSVSINNNNTFQPGTVLSLPNLSLLSMPSSGFQQNDGLQAALRADTIEVRELRDLPDIIAQIQTYGSWHTPDYVTSGSVIQMSGSKFSADQFKTGRIHRLSCPGGSFSIDTKGLTTTIRKAVIVTDCAVSLGAGLVLEDAVLATTNTGTKSITGTSGLQIGRIDACQPGGSAQILTMGSLSLPSGFNMHGSQVIAAGDIKFSAGAVGIGLSLIAGGEINGTSNMLMYRCSDGMEDNFRVDHYRLAL